MRHLLLAMGFGLAPWAATAAELLMFDAYGCMHCELWKDDIGVYYHKTREGKSAPLRIVSLDEKRPEDLDWIEGVRFSPTFVLIHNDREIGRIVGYPGEDLFWMNMETVFRRLGSRQSP